MLSRKDIENQKQLFPFRHMPYYSRDFASTSQEARTELASEMPCIAMNPFEVESEGDQRLLTVLSILRRTLPLVWWSLFHGRSSHPGTASDHLAMGRVRTSACPVCGAVFIRVPASSLSCYMQTIGIAFLNAP